MCVIIIKNNQEKLDEAIIAKALALNPHGFGIQLLDDGTVYKTMDAATAQEYMRTTRPFVAHARLTTVGRTCLENVHPVKINEYNWLFHNGTVSVPHNWDRDKSDSRFVAETLRNTNWRNWKNILSMTDSRFCYTRVSKSGQFYVNRTGKWFMQEGVKYSKSNILDYGNNLVAVYGTLRQGYHNHHLLANALLVGAGETLESYRMVCDGIPYVLPGDTPEGHRIHVEVYAVTDDELESMDRLEGHPGWYERTETKVLLSNGMVVNSWLYFNDQAESSGPYFKNYEHYRDPIAKVFNPGSIFEQDLIYDEQEGKYFDLTTDEYLDDNQLNLFDR